MNEIKASGTVMMQCYKLHYKCSTKTVGTDGNTPAVFSLTTLSTQWLGISPPKKNPCHLTIISDNNYNRKLKKKKKKVDICVCKKNTI